MTALAPLATDRFGPGTFGTAVGLAVIAGALAIEIPSLTSLVGVLAALALAGWASLARGAGAGPSGRRPSLAGCFGLLGAAAFYFVTAPPPLESTRGLVLAAGLLPLWLVERRRSDVGSGGVAVR